MSKGYVDADEGRRSECLRSLICTNTSFPIPARVARNTVFPTDTPSTILMCILAHEQSNTYKRPRSDKSHPKNNHTYDISSQVFHLYQPTYDKSPPHPYSAIVSYLPQTLTHSSQNRPLPSTIPTTSHPDPNQPSTVLPRKHPSYPPNTTRTTTYAI